MSEHNWTYGSKKNNHGSKHNHSNPSHFPRHIMMEYEGTRLSMRKRMWSKSNPGSVYGKSAWILNDNCINGLINKYIGKPYTEFLKEWHKKVKNMPSDVTDRVLDYRFGIGWYASKGWYSHPYAIDDEGIIRKGTPRKRRSRRGNLTKDQVHYNYTRFKLPDLGCVRDTTKITKATGGYGYCEAPVKPEFMGPIKLGKAYVEIDGEVQLRTIYHNLIAYNKRHMNCAGDRKKFLEKEEYLKEWTPVKVFGVAKGSSHKVIVDNPTYKYYETQWKKATIACNLEYSESNAHTVDYYYKLLQSTPKQCILELGMDGDWSFWVRNSD